MVVYHYDNIVHEAKGTQKRKLLEIAPYGLNAYILAKAKSKYWIRVDSIHHDPTVV